MQLRGKKVEGWSWEQNALDLNESLLKKGAKLLQSCLPLCNPMCSPSGSSVHGILQERIHLSGLPCPLPGDLPHPGIEPTSLTSPALAGRFFTTRATWEAPYIELSICQTLKFAKPIIHCTIEKASIIFKSYKCQGLHFLQTKFFKNKISLISKYF